MGASVQGAGEIASLRELLARIPGIVWTTDRELTITLTGGTGLARIGSWPGRTVGMSLRDAIPAGVRTEEMVALHRRALEGETGSLRACVQGRALECLIEPLHGEAGAIVGVIAAAVDVTERVGAEELLARQERRLAVALEATGCAVWRLAPGAEDLSWSGPIGEVLGSCDPSELGTVAAWLERCVHPDDRERVEAAVASLRSRPGRIALDHRILWPDGSVHWVQGIVRSIAHDESGLELIGTARLSDDEKRTQQTLEEALLRYRVLFDGSPLPVMVWDWDTHRILEVNDAAVRTYGYTADEFRRLTLEDIRPPEAIPDLHQAIEDTDRSTHSPVHMPHTFTHRRRDGSLFEVRTVAAHIDLGGREARIALIEDITERKQFEQRVEQSQRLEALGRLAGGIAHDFNNLLTAIRGWADLAGDEDGVPAEVSYSLGQITTAADRGSDLTRQLLVFSTRTREPPAPVSPNAVLAELEPMLRRLIGEHIELDVQLEPEVGLAVAGAGQLDQIIVNLVVNARDAMPSGGVLTISTGEVELEGAIGGARTATRRYVRIAVRDTGIGMDRPTQDRIFEPFFTTKPDGTGLGLSVVYGIVSEINGQLAVESEPGRGTTITVCLPWRPSDAEAEQAPRESRPVRGTETILLVEDDALVRELLQRLLGELGYEVLVAEHPHEASTLFDEREVAAVVTDVVMPGMTGPELVAKLRERRAGLPVLYLSGYAGDALADGSLGLGSAFLGKPFTTPVLARTLRELLDGRE